MPTKKRRLLIGLIAFSVIVIGLLVAVLIYVVPHQKEIQAWVESFGTAGGILLFLLSILTTVVGPLNYTAVGLGGGFIYGTSLAFLILLAGRTTGCIINFYLGHHYGRKILTYFISEEAIGRYDRIFESERTILLYFALSFLPFLPNDYAAYFMGFSSVKKTVFIPITVVGNLGSNFCLAYIGSGKAFSNPIFLFSFFTIFLCGLAWIHNERKKLQLK